MTEGALLFRSAPILNGVYVPAPLVLGCARSGPHAHRRALTAEKEKLAARICESGNQLQRDEANGAL